MKITNEKTIHISKESLKYFRKPIDPKAKKTLLELAIKNDDDNDKFYTELGAIFLSNHQYDKAKELYEKALKIMPHSINARIGFCEAELAMGNLSNTIIKHLYETINISPESVSARLKLAKLLQIKNKKKELENILIDSIKVCSKKYAYTDHLAKCLEHLVSLYIKKESITRAIDMCDLSLSLARNNTAALAIKSQLLFLIGNYEEAITISDPLSAIEIDQLWEDNSTMATVSTFHKELIDSFEKGNPTYEPGTTTRKGYQRRIYNGECQYYDQLTNHIFNEINRRKIQSQISEIITQFESFHVSSWCVKLKQGGYQEPHYHPYGAVSGIYYIQTPSSDQNKQGWLELGSRSEFLTKTRIKNRKTINPKPGKLILFPSWLHHRTIPTTVKDIRVSFAFDLRPII